MAAKRLAVTVAAVLISSTALAQGLRDRDPALDAAKRLSSELQRATFHAGSFYLLSSFQIADIGYERNDEFYVPTNDQTSGVSLSVNAPHRLYYVPNKKVILSADVVPGYSFFRSDDESNQLSYLVRGDAQFIFNHLYLDAYVSRSDALRASVGEINRLVTAVEDSVGVNSEVKYSSKTSMVVTANHRETSYPKTRIQPDDRPVERLGRSENNLRLSGIHKTFPRTSLTVATEASTYDFAEQPSYTKSSRRYLAPGVIWSGDFFTVRAEAGPGQLTFNGTGDDFEGILGNLHGTMHFGRRWTTNVALTRDVEFSIATDNNYYIVERALTQATYVLTQRWSLRGSAHVGRDLYDTPILGVLREDQLSFISGGFIHSTRRWRAGLEVGYFQRDSNFVADTQQGIRLVVNLSFTP